jgi:two-component sensor histidine kinase
MAENYMNGVCNVCTHSPIVNELPMNSIRHTFPRKQHGEIRNVFSIIKGNINRSIAKTMSGSPMGCTPGRLNPGGSCLIQGLAKQIRDTVEPKNRAGTQYTFTFPVGIRERT